MIRPPPRAPGTRGAPRQQGARQPTLLQRVADPTTDWEEVTVRWYGGRRQRVELASGTALWYHSGLPVVPLRWVLIRDLLGNFESHALLSTDQCTSAAPIVACLGRRWQVEVRFAEARAPLGSESHRQWSALAILRTTPALLGMFSLVTLFAHQLLQGRDMSARQAAWYQQPGPTFSDTLAFVRQQRWPVSVAWLAPAKPDVVIIPKALFERLIDTLAFAA